MNVVRHYFYRDNEEPILQGYPIIRPIQQNGKILGEKRKFFPLLGKNSKRIP
jgi:hypothetical protein